MFVHGSGLLFTLLLYVSLISDSIADTAAKDSLMTCDKLMEELNWTHPIEVLNHISDLFHNSCYRETIEVASKARELFRFKKYSFVKETAEIFVGEGRMTDYVLESYERGYLSLLILLAYMRLHEPLAAMVELNRFYHEEVAFLYNHGQDPMNAALQAVLWENDPSPGFSSRPFWLWLSQNEETESELRAFARQRVVEFDQGNNRAPWSIAELGRFPQLNSRNGDPPALADWRASVWMAAKADEKKAISTGPPVAIF